MLQTFFNTLMYSEITTNFDLCVTVLVNSLLHHFVLHPQNLIRLMCNSPEIFPFPDKSWVKYVLINVTSLLIWHKLHQLPSGWEDEDSIQSEFWSSLGLFRPWHSGLSFFLWNSNFRKINEKILFQPKGMEQPGNKQFDPKFQQWLWLWKWSNFHRWLCWVQR